MNRTKKYRFVTILAVILVSAFFSPAYPSNGVAVNHLYSLANFTGVVPYNGGRISVDRRHDEVYLLFQNFVRVYNRSGMEIYGFGNDPALGWMRDLAVDENGDIFILTYGERLADSNRWSFHIVRCNFRGQARETITVQNLPPEFSHIVPGRLFYREGRFYLASLTS